MARLRVGILASGTGTLLEAVLAAQDETYEIVVVVSDRGGVRALEIAEAAGIPAIVVDWDAYGKERRADFSSEVAVQLRARDVDLVCSAGFGRILSPNYFPEIGVPSLNSHPALLPSFPGAHGVRDALEHGAKVTGTTIHLQDDGVDTGPIVAQRAVEVLPGDTEETLHARIKTVEQQLYPEVIRLFAQGRIKVEGRRVHIL